jgi:hypothetical protein
MLVRSLGRIAARQTFVDVGVPVIYYYPAHDSPGSSTDVGWSTVVSPVTHAAAPCGLDTPSNHPQSCPNVVIKPRGVTAPASDSQPEASPTH